MSITSSQNVSTGNAMGNAATVEQLLGNTVKSALMPELSGMGFTYLSPESLLDLVARQVQKLDSDIFTHMEQIDARREAGLALSVATSAMKEAKLGLEENAQYFGSVITVTGMDYKTGNGSGQSTGKNFPNTEQGAKDAQAYADTLMQVTINKPQKPEAIADITKKLEAAAQQAQAAGQGALAQSLQKMADDLKAGKAPTKGQLEKLINDADSTVKSLSSSSEITMIQLQDLVQQRSRTIMFASNVLASINDAARKTVDNLR